METAFKEWDRSNLKGSRVQISAIGRLPESWMVKRIGDLAKNKKGAIKIGPFGSQLKKEEMVESGVSVFGQENVFNKNFKKGTYFISKEKYEKLKSVELFAGDIVLTMMGTIGDCCVVPPEINTGIMDSHLMRIQVNESVNPNYFSRLIRESYIVKKQVECLSQGAIMSGLNLALVKDIYLPIPPLPEQRKIAEILSTVDEGIEKTDAIIEQTQQFKNGLMQKLFAEGIGHTRFKDTKIGRIPEEWEVNILASITESFLNGGTPNTNIDDYWNGDIPWITGTDVVETIIVPSRRFITNKGLKNSASNLIPKGNILVVTRTGVGKIALAGCDIAISQDLTGVILNKKRAHNVFYLWFLKRHSPKYIALAQGTTIGGILRKDVEKTLVPIPPIEEQHKIAEVLSEIDANIEIEQAYKAELEQLKKGLMQVLLTGKVMVKVKCIQN